ncbi:MAG: response regulator [Deltaproteobacteria bacterium]|nr:response regulator [Deltaproteobacteria bacterium]
MTRKIKLLIVDDEERFLRTLAQRLTLRDFDVTPVGNGAQAVEIAREQAFDLAIVDLKMPGIGGEKVLELLKKQDPHIEVVILTGHGTIDSAVECTKLGSYHYLQKPCETEELLDVLKNAYWRRVQSKLRVDEDKLSALLDSATHESPLSILRKLRTLEESGKPPEK